MCKKKCSRSFYAAVQRDTTRGQSTFGNSTNQLVCSLVKREKFVLVADPLKKKKKRSSVGWLQINYI